MPGSGKTTVGLQLSDELKLPFFDLDKVIEKEQGIGIPEIFALHGEVYFRTLEADMLRSFSKHPAFLMATGGGTPCFHQNMQLMNREGLTVWLNWPLDVLNERLRKSTERPLLAGDMKEKLQLLWEKRKAIYQQAQVVIETPDQLKELYRELRTTEA
jgi:shikimate kinase